MQTAHNITFAGEDMVLNGDRTLWWPRRKILFATDLHAGKTEHMRRYGLAIPGGSIQDDLDRLTKAAATYKPERLIFLGDLFHSEANMEWNVFADWCQKQTFAVELVRGNHDRFLSDELLQSASLIVHTEPYTIAPFTLQHHPNEQTPEQPTLAGHLHPVVWLTGSAKERWRLPCFWLQERQLILPAFGSFTGGLSIQKHTNQQVYACAPDFQTIITIPRDGKATEFY